MYNTRYSRAVTIILGVTVAIVGRLLGWSLVMIFLLLAALLVLRWLYDYWRTWRTLGWFRTYNAYSARVREGEVEPVIAELTARRAAGDTSPQTAITLAAAYNYRGQGPEAEPLALEAFDAVRSSGACESEKLAQRVKCDLAYLTRFDALLAQGRFTEAASGLRERIPQAIQPNFITALTAWAYYLGGNELQARDLVIHIRTPGPRISNHDLLTPRFELVVAYLRRVLHEADTLSEIVERREMIDEWAVTADRNAGNPYGRRLRDVVAKMRALLPDDTAPPDAAPPSGEPGDAPDKPAPTPTGGESA